MTTTRQNEIRRILTRLDGKEPDESEVSKMANIAEAADISPNDALFPLLVALRSYSDAYAKVPEAIKDASAFMLREHASALNAQAESIRAQHGKEMERVSSELTRLFNENFRKVIPAIIHETVGETAKAAVREASSRLEDAASAATNAGARLHNAAATNYRNWVFGGVLVAILAGGIGGMASAWFMKDRVGGVQLTTEQKNSMQWGDALQKSWSKLPPQAQKILKDAAGITEK